MTRKSPFIAQDGRILVSGFSFQQMALLSAFRRGYEAAQGEMDLLIIKEGPSKRKNRMNWAYESFTLERDRFITSILNQRQRLKYRVAIEKLRSRK